MVIWSLDHSDFGFEVTCCDFKKSFFWRLQRLQKWWWILKVLKSNFFVQTVLQSIWCVLRHSLQSYDFIEKFWRHKWYKLLLWKNSEAETTSVGLPKGTKTEVIFDKLGVSFWKKWRIFHFPAIKTDWWVKECFNHYQSKALII